MTNQIETHAEKALKLFDKGNNCAQAVLSAFSEELGLDEREALRLAASFGGGIGGMKGVCGALTGLFMAAGLKYGYEAFEPGTDVKAVKDAHNKRIQGLAEAFRQRFGAIDCASLLKAIDEDPEWKAMKRPCSVYVAAACELMEKLED